MSVSLSSVSACLLLVAFGAAPVGPQPFTSYAEGYKFAQESKRPLLVIMHGDNKVDWSMIERSEARRNLLANYVVVTVDVTTEEGKQTHALFQSPALPQVVVIDKQQKLQIYRTSKALSAEDWTVVLEQYREGNWIPPRPATTGVPFCPSCQGYRF